MRRDELSGTPEPNFIGCWILENDALCDRIVDYFEQNSEAQAPGKTGVGRVDDSYKQSLDICVRPKDVQKPGFEAIAEYMGLLHECFRDYTEQWNFLKTFMATVHVGSFNVQKYETGGHFSKLHSERARPPAGSPRPGAPPRERAVAPPKRGQSVPAGHASAAGSDRRQPRPVASSRPISASARAPAG